MQNEDRFIVAIGVLTLLLGVAFILTGSQFIRLNRLEVKQEAVEHADEIQCVDDVEDQFRLPCGFHAVPAWNTVERERIWCCVPEKEPVPTTTDYQLYRYDGTIGGQLQ